MPAHRNRELEERIESLLKSARTKDDLAKLFCSFLGFEYVGRAFSNRDKDNWGEGEIARIAAEQSFEILARHGDVASGGFAIIWCELKPFNRSIQRTLVQQLCKRFPAALFLFADRDSFGTERGARVHIVHAKVSGPVSSDEASQRLILRRFRIGPGERYRTASERLAKLDLNARPHIGTLELGHICDQAFDKEALTDEFFKKLDRHIRAVETDLRENQPDLDAKEAFTQSQLLIERLVFLCFAQNRGWLNQEADYLIKNFAKHKKDSDGFGFYQEFLHRLFRSLAEPSFGDRLVGIPFLNGGLFDDDEFRPPQSKLRIRNETFAALFNDLLEAYNFTVREDTPLSQEVAVDPEMLGKVFESIVLHAESAGEEFQAPDKRKAIGHISQLLNLEMNFRRGDSLHDYICGHPVRLDGTQLADYNDALARIEKSGQELHQAKRAEKKKRLRLEILAQRLDLGKRVVTDQIRALSTNQQVGDCLASRVRTQPPSGGWMRKLPACATRSSNWKRTKRNFSACRPSRWIKTFTADCASWKARNLTVLTISSGASTFRTCWLASLPPRSPANSRS